MLNVVRAWILLSTLLAGAGWVLSAFHELNRIGYAIVFALAAAAVFVCRKKIQWLTREGLRRGFHKFPRRFKRPAPLLFLMLASLSLFSGILYAPYNSDTSAYRFPRVLHWLGQEQWHWIHTSDMRMNVAGCGYEWLVAPVMLFTRTDRCLFLINWVSYLMLPGLTFCVFRFLGLRPRFAWWWAWLLSSGWCYVLQSASVANDAMAVIYALAAVALAMKARVTGNSTDFWLSLLAAALLTGLKQTAIPLVLLWVLAAWPGRRIAFAAPKTFGVVGLLGLLVSGVPTTVFNFLHTGTWDGISAMQAEYPDWHIQLDSPFWGIVGNAFCLPAQNLVPPFFPWSGEWNHAMSVFLGTSFGGHFRSFESFGGLSPGISESSAGIGLGIILMAVISICLARRCKQSATGMKSSRLQTALRLTPWILLLIYMAKVGDVQNARHLAPYYVFLFPSLLIAAGHEKLVRQIWWQRTALLSVSLAGGLLLVNTNRPLFPAMTIASWLHASHPQSKIISVLHAAYAAPYSLQNINERIMKKLPADEPIIGYATSGNGQLEPGLWVPLGSRRIERVLKQDTPAQLNAHGIHYVVIEGQSAPDCSDVQEWLASYHAGLVADFTFQKKSSSSNLSHVYIARLDGAK
jgi:hypothetical protein